MVKLPFVNLDPVD